MRKNKLKRICQWSKDIVERDVDIFHLCRSIIANHKILIISKKFNIEEVVEKFNLVTNSRDISLSIIKQKITVRKRTSTIPNDFFKDCEYAELYFGHDIKFSEIEDFINEKERDDKFDEAIDILNRFKRGELDDQFPKGSAVRIDIEESCIKYKNLMEEK